MMSDVTQKTILEKPGTLLAAAQIIVLVLMAGYIFAVVETEQNTQGHKIQIHDSLIENNRLKIQEHEIEQAVTNEQYRQIMIELKKLNEKMDSRR
jgi:capsular polysaccharide biosynthesis protein